MCASIPVFKRYHVSPLCMTAGFSLCPRWWLFGSGINTSDFQHGREKCTNHCFSNIIWPINFPITYVSHHKHHHQTGRPFLTIHNFTHVRMMMRKVQGDHQIHYMTLRGAKFHGDLSSSCGNISLKCQPHTIINRRTDPLETIKVCTKFQGNPSNSGGPTNQLALPYQEPRR